METGNSPAPVSVSVPVAVLVELSREGRMASGDWEERTKRNGNNMGSQPDDDSG